MLQEILLTAAPSAGNASLTNVVPGDVVNPGTVTISTTGNTSTSGNLKAGSYTGIQKLTSISGADAGNYDFTTTQVGNYNVSQLVLTGSIAAGNTTYGSSLTAGNASLTNVVPGDVVNPGTVTISTTGNTSTSGNLKAGSYTGIQKLTSISGADAGNYDFTTTPGR